MKILIVDGSKIMREKLVRFLELQNNFDYVFEAGTVKEAKNIMEEKEIDVLLFDIQLNDSSGLDLVPFSRKFLHKPLLILCSNYKMPQYLSTYERLAINYFFDKYSELADLKSFIKTLAMDWRNLSMGSSKTKFNWNERRPQ